MSHRLTAAIKKDDRSPHHQDSPRRFALREWEEKKGKRGSAAPVQAPSDDGDGAQDGEAARRGEHPRDRGRAARRRGQEPGSRRRRRRGSTTSRRPSPAKKPSRADLAASGRRALRRPRGRRQVSADPRTPRPAGWWSCPAGGRRAPTPAPAPQGPWRRGTRNDVAAGPGSAAPAERGSQGRIDAGSGGASGAPIDDLSGAKGASPAPPRGPWCATASRSWPLASRPGSTSPSARAKSSRGKTSPTRRRWCSRRSIATPGPAPIRAVAEALARRGRLQGDPQLATAQAGAALRADNLRRTSSGQRPRFRFGGGGRVALTDWALSGELPRLEQEVIAAIERYRDASRRAHLRRLQELPGHALIELALLAIERVGMTNIKAVRTLRIARWRGSFLGHAQDRGRRDPHGDRHPARTGARSGRERVTDLRERHPPLRPGQHRLADHDGAGPVGGARGGGRAGRSPRDPLRRNGRLQAPRGHRRRRR